MILVDSSVWIDFFRGVPSPEAEWLDRALGRERIAVGDLITTEVLQGFVRDRDYRQASAVLESLARIEIAGFDTCNRAVVHYRTLRSRGITVRKTIDTLIATRCIADGLPLLFSDRDFDPFVTHLGLVSAMSVH